MLLILWGLKGCAPMGTGLATSPAPSSHDEGSRYALMTTDPNDLVALAKAVPPDVIRSIYGDLASPALRQFGRFGEDAVKMLRLALFPIQLFAAAQDRVEAYFNNAIRQVPEERIIAPVQSILLPVAEKLRFQEEGSIITELYINLLARAMDGERVGEAHPAFVGLIAQLAPDEVLFLENLSDKEYTLIIKMNELWTTPSEADIARVYRQHNLSSALLDKSNSIIFNYRGLNQPEMFYVFLEHLYHIGLVQYTNDPSNFGQYRNVTRATVGQPRLIFIKLSRFGQLFYNACIPGEHGRRIAE